MSRHSRSATHKPIEFVIPISSACRHVRIERRGLATACTLAAAAMLLAGAVTAGAQSGGPPEYGYDSIPFGNTAQQIIRELSGATIEEAGSEAHFINHYEVLPDFFAEGLEPDWLGIQPAVERRRNPHVPGVVRRLDQRRRPGAVFLPRARRTRRTWVLSSVHGAQDAEDGRQRQPYRGLQRPDGSDQRTSRGRPGKLRCQVRARAGGADLQVGDGGQRHLPAGVPEYLQRQRRRHPVTATASSGENTWQRTARMPASRPVPPAAAFSPEERHGRNDEEGGDPRAAAGGAGRRADPGAARRPGADQGAGGADVHRVPDLRSGRYRGCPWARRGRRGGGRRWPLRPGRRRPGGDHGAARLRHMPLLPRRAFHALHAQDRSWEPAPQPARWWHNAPVVRGAPAPTPSTGWRAPGCCRGSPRTSPSITRR